MRTIDLASTYLHLETGAGLNVLDVDESFWATIDDRDDLNSGRLVMASIVDTDWAMWEMHPDGDEVILVTDGVVRVHIRDDATGDDATDDEKTDDDVTIVRAPHLVVMPAGTWHTMDVIERARVVTITWGAGTQHRPR